MQHSGTKNWIERHFWVVFADVLGAGWLISLLLTANGSPALKPLMLWLMMLVPLTGLAIMLSGSRQNTAKAQSAPAPVTQRTIFISPRPESQRS